MKIPNSDRSIIDKTLKTLFSLEDVIELRAIHKSRGRIDSGYFDGAHRDALINVTASLNQDGANVYVVMNSINSQLLGRYANRVQQWAKSTTTDNDVIKRKWLLVDLDPVRPKDTASTDAQLKAAAIVSVDVVKFLDKAGWPRPVTAMSGNGCHLLYRIDLPNDKHSTDLIKGILAGLGSRFDTDLVKVDRSVYNAARITKLYGTVSNKGDHTSLTPWRVSEIRSVPTNLQAVSKQQLEALLSTFVKERLRPKNKALNEDLFTYTPFDLEAFLERVGIAYEQDRHDNRDRFKLEHCPFNEEHGKGDAAVFRSDDGVLGFNCFHDSCSEKTWKDLRDLVDGPKAERVNSEKSERDTPFLFDETETPEIPSGLLPGWLGEYVEAVSRSTQTPLAMAALLGLSVVATCAAKRFIVEPQRSGYTEPLNIWTVTAMPPASRKTAVVSAMTKPLSEWESNEATRLTIDIQSVESRRKIVQQHIEQLEKRASRHTTSDEDRESAIQRIAELRSQLPDEIRLPRLWTGDTTSERLQGLLVDHGERMAVLSDESGIFEVMAGLYNDGKANNDIYLQAHAGQAVRVDRQGRSAHLNAPALSFGLTIQPGLLAEMTSGGKKRFRTNGTLARFLYGVPKSNIGTRNVRDVYRVPTHIEASYQAGIFDLLTIQPVFEDGREVPKRLSLSADALEVWHSFGENIEKRHGRGGDLESISDWSGKLPGAVLRVAGVFHLVENGSTPPEIVAVETVGRAVQLCTLLIDHAKAAFSLMGAEQSVGDAKAIYEWIESQRLESFTRTDVYRNFKGRFTGKTDRLDKAMTELEERGIVWKKIEQTAGRKATIYSVNPIFWEAA